MGQPSPRTRVARALLLAALLAPAAASGQVCDASAGETTCGSICCPYRQFCCGGVCSTDPGCGNLCGPDYIKCGVGCCDRCRQGQRAVQVSCGGDSCSCADACGSAADCRSGCCQQGVCVPACACGSQVEVKLDCGVPIGTSNPGCGAAAGAPGAGLLSALGLLLARARRRAR